MSTEIVYIPSEEKRERKTVLVDRELERIYKKHKNITPDLILTEATKPTHVLHSYFEWNDTVAAAKYRKAQAYTLILGSRFVCQLVSNGDTPVKVSKTRVRRLVSAFRGEGFRMRKDVLSDPDARQAVIETKRGVLRSWCNSTIDILELEPLRQAIEKLL